MVSGFWNQVQSRVGTDADFPSSCGPSVSQVFVFALCNIIKSARYVCPQDTIGLSQMIAHMFSKIIIHVNAKSQGSPAESRRLH